MKRILALVMAGVMVLALCACGCGKAATDGEAATEATTEAPSTITETENLTIDGIYVDSSYTDDDGSSLKMVYMFYTVSPQSENLEIDSVYTEMTIGENTYKAENYPDSCKFTPSYYYGSYVKDVYVGDNFKVAATFKIPEGALTAGNDIVLSDYQIADFEEIKMSTDDIVFCDNIEALAEAADPEGYAEELVKREDADAETVSKVKNAINGYYFSFYVNSTSYQLEFWAPNNFEVRTAFGGNQGTYTVKNGYVFCTYPSTGHTVEIPYTFENGDISLDCTEAFDVY